MAPSQAGGHRHCYRCPLHQSMLQTHPKPAQDFNTFRLQMNITAYLLDVNNFSSLSMRCSLQNFATLCAIVYIFIRPDFSPPDAYPPSFALTLFLSTSRFTSLVEQLVSVAPGRTCQRHRLMFPWSRSMLELHTIP